MRALRIIWKRTSLHTWYGRNFHSPQSPPSQGGFVPRGFKTELLRLLGNACYRHRPSQDTVYARGGLRAVMGLSMLDCNQPYLFPALPADPPPADVGVDQIRNIKTINSCICAHTRGSVFTVVNHHHWKILFSTCFPVMVSVRAQ